MAGNADTLGDFKIRLETEGADKVKKDLEEIRAGLSSLHTSIEQLKNGGAGLAGIFGNFRFPGWPGGSGGSGGAPSPAPAPTPSPSPAPNPAPAPGGRPAPAPGVPPTPPSPDGGGDGGGRGETPLVGIIRRWQKFWDKDAKEKGRTFTRISRTLRGMNVNGASGLIGGASAMAGNLGRVFGAIGIGKLGIAALALQGAEAWYRNDRQEQGVGKNLWSTLAASQTRLNTIRLDAESISKLALAMRHEYMVYEGGTVNAEKSDDASHQAALQTHQSLATQMALYRTRGQIPAWMNAFWMQGVDTSKFESASQEELPFMIAKELSGLRQRLSREQYITLMAEIGQSLGSMITNMGNKFKVDEIDNLLKETKGGSTTYSREWLGQAIGEQVGIAKNQDAYFDAAVTGRGTALRKAARPLAKFEDIVFGDIKSAWETVGSATTIGGPDIRSEKQKKKDRAFWKTILSINPVPTAPGVPNPNNEFIRQLDEIDKPPEVGPLRSLLPEVDKTTMGIDDTRDQHSSYRATGAGGEAGALGNAHITFEIHGATDTQAVARACRDELQRLIIPAQSELAQATMCA